MPHTPAAACAIEPFVFKTYHVDNFYRVDHADQQVIQFSCLTNFHLVAGDLRWTCQHNGTWSGTEPLCAVDFLKDKWTLSGFIITVSFFLPMLWLGTDFYRFVQKRTRVRKTRYRFGPICDIRKNEMLLGENHRIFRKVSTTYRASSIAYAMEMDYMRSAHCSDIEEFFKVSRSRSKTSIPSPSPGVNQETQRKFFWPKQKSSPAINQFGQLGEPYWRKK